MFTHTDILQEFVESARTTVDQSANCEANQYRTYLEIRRSDNSRRATGWFRRKKRKVDAAYRAKPENRARNKEYQRQYYLRKKAECEKVVSS